MYLPSVPSASPWLPPTRAALPALGLLPQVVPSAKAPPSGLCWHLHLAFNCCGPSPHPVTCCIIPAPNLFSGLFFSVHWGSGCMSSGGLASPPATLAEQVTIVGEGRSPQGRAQGQSCCPDLLEETGVGVPALQWGPQLLVLSTRPIPLPWHGLEMGPWHCSLVGLAS